LAVHARTPLPPEETYLKARAAAQKALEIDPRAVKESIYGIAATGKPALSVPFRNQEQGFFECLL